MIDFGDLDPYFQGHLVKFDQMLSAPYLMNSDQNLVDCIILMTKRLD